MRVVLHSKSGVWRSFFALKRVCRCLHSTASGRWMEALMRRVTKTAEYNIIDHQQIKFPLTKPFNRRELPDAILNFGNKNAFVWTPQQLYSALLKQWNLWNYSNTFCCNFQLSLLSIIVTDRLLICELHLALVQTQVLMSAFSHYISITSWLC